MDVQTELEIKAELAREEFRLRSLAEAEVQCKVIAEEIKAVLRKHGASLAEWNNNLYIVPTGFQVYSRWNGPRGVEIDPVDVGLTCHLYNCNYYIAKPFPKELMPR